MLQKGKIAIDFFLWGLTCSFSEGCDWKFGRLGNLVIFEYWWKIVLVVHRVERIGFGFDET